MVQARPKLQTVTKYALVELTPPKLSDIPAIRSGKIRFTLQLLLAWIFFFDFTMNRTQFLNVITRFRTRKIDFWS